MSQLFGEHKCKLDAKARMRIPSPILKQLGGEGPHSFVLNRGIEKCLILYPRNVWDEVVEEVNQLNQFVAEHRRFVRLFYRGATNLTTDSTERILIPKSLAEYASIKKEVTVVGLVDRIEIWATEKYNELFNDDDPDSSEYSNLAQKVLGDAKPKNDTPE